MVVVVSVLLALLAATLPAWWSTRERGPRRPFRVWLMTVVARGWLRRTTSRGVVGRLARSLILSALAGAGRVEGDARLALPRRLLVVAHPDDAALLRRHGEECAAEVAVVLRTELGLLCVPSRPSLVVSSDESVSLGRPRVDRADPGTADEEVVAGAGADPSPGPSPRRPRHVVPTRVVPTSEELTLPVRDEETTVVDPR